MKMLERVSGPPTSTVNKLHKEGIYSTKLVPHRKGGIEDDRWARFGREQVEARNQTLRDRVETRSQEPGKARGSRDMGARVARPLAPTKGR